MDVSYALLFFAGLLGGIGHCVGMCGPLLAALGVAKPISGEPGSLWASVRSQLHYHLGRLLTYAMLGALMGFVGSFLDLAGRLGRLQSLTAILAGALMIGMALYQAGWWSWRLKPNADSRWGRWVHAGRLQLLRAGSGRPFVLGLGFGLLPCGLVTTAELAAAASGSALAGAFTLLAFGIGTLPGLLGFGTAMAAMGLRWRQPVYQAACLLMAGAGVLLIWRGWTAALAG